MKSEELISWLYISAARIGQLADLIGQNGRASAMRDERDRLMTVIERLESGESVTPKV